VGKMVINKQYALGKESKKGIFFPIRKGFLGKARKNAFNLYKNIVQ
jgi:hypothetical protein